MKTTAARLHEPPATIESWLAERSRAACPPNAVMLHAPSFAFQSPGGGENQLVQTAMHLDTLGVPVRLFSPWIDRLETGRLLHLFGMSREGLELARVARARGIPVVLSPICWYEPRALLALEQGFIGKFASLAAWGLRCLSPSIPGWRRELLQASDRVLPNSPSEAGQLIELFGVARDRIRVVPNGVAPSVALASPELFQRQWGADPFVLFVGRIEPRKNVFGLIRALNGMNLPLVVIGEAPPRHEGYMRECRRAGPASSRGSGGSIIAIRFWLRPMPRRGSSRCQAGLKHPAWPRSRRRFPGCAITITPYGCTRDYFGSMVEYARPDRVAEIRRAISKCWENGPDARLSRSIATHYLWPNVAQTTAEVYDQVAR